MYIIIMINSQEILIECNMKNSESNERNTFTSTIGGGIQLEPGDKIEIRFPLNDSSIKSFI